MLVGRRDRLVAELSAVLGVEVPRLGSSRVSHAVGTSLSARAARSIQYGISISRNIASAASWTYRLRLARAGRPAASAASLPFQTHVLVRRGEVEERVQADRGLLEPRANAVQRGGLEDRAVHDSLVHQPLDLVQQGLALLLVALLRLSAEQVVDVRIAAIG